MEFLSESQLKLISNFRERVRQSEERLRDTLHHREHTPGLRTPESLPYINTHGDVSKVSETYYDQTEDATINQNITIADINSPPQKQLKTTVFNESPNGNGEADVSHVDDPEYNQSPVDNNLKVSSDEELSDRHENLQAYKIKDSYVPNSRDSERNKKNKHKESDRNKNSSTLSERDRLDESYKKLVGVQANKQGYPPRSISSRRKEPNSVSRTAISYEETHDLPSQTSQYYENRLDEYLQSQDKRGSEMNSIQSRDLYDMNSQYIYQDEHNRLKVPSIRLYEEAQRSHPDSNNLSHASRGHDHNVSHETRSVLAVKDNNVTRPKTKEKGKEGLKQVQNYEKEQSKSLKKVPSYPKKEKGNAVDKSKGLNSRKSNLENQDVNVPSQQIKRRDKSKSISTRKENNNERTKARSLSKDLKGSAKAHKSMIARINAENEIENEKVRLAKDLLRKFKLGTIDQTRFIKILEDQMEFSPDFFENLKELAK